MFFQNGTTYEWQQKILGCSPPAWDLYKSMMERLLVPGTTDVCVNWIISVSNTTHLKAGYYAVGTWFPFLTKLWTFMKAWECQTVCATQGGNLNVSSFFQLHYVFIGIANSAGTSLIAPIYKGPMTHVLAWDPWGSAGLPVESLTWLMLSLLSIHIDICAIG